MLIVIAVTVFCATVLGSISGIGGGVIIKPVMDAVTSLSASTISFLSGTTVLVMTVASLLRSRKGDVRIDRRGTYLALGGAFGGLLGKMLFSYVSAAAPSSAFVSFVQNIFMVLLTVAVLVYCLFKDRVRTMDVQKPALCAAAGLGLGVMSSFLGIGGGPINIMVLSWLFGMDTKTTALTSLYIIFFSQTVSFISTCITGLPPFEPLLLLLMAVLAVLGATLGRTLSKKMDSRKVDVLFMCMLVIIIAISIYNTVRFGLVR